VHYRGLFCDYYLNLVPKAQGHGKHIARLLRRAEKLVGIILGLGIFKSSSCLRLFPSALRHGRQAINAASANNRTGSARNWVNSTSFVNLYLPPIFIKVPSTTIFFSLFNNP